MFAKYRKKLREDKRRRFEREVLSGFDPVWYYSRYADLAGLRNTAEIRNHYLIHGHGEGRFPNASAEEEADYRRYLRPSKDFDLAAYRLLNPDLASHLRNDQDFILHFIRHGRAEGRQAVFASHEAAGEGGEPWTHIFNVAHYSAWTMQDKYAAGFSSKAEALAHFREHGIRKLAPIHFDHIFDAGFYRNHYGISESDDVALYREWLGAGLLAGRFANEQSALMPLAGRRSFPTEFDWQGYVQSRDLECPTRAMALQALLDTENDWLQVRPYIAGSTANLLLLLVRYRLQQGRVDEAYALLNQAGEQEGAWPAILHAAKGEVLTKLGQHREALAALERALSDGDGSWSTLHLAVTIAADLEDGQRAIALLKQHRAAWIGKADYNALVETTMDRLFAIASRNAWTRLPTLPIGTVDAEFESQMSLLVEAIADLQREPARIGSAQNAPVLVLGDESVRQCTHYRIEQKAEQFERAGIPLQRYSMDQVAALLNALPGCRAVIFYRVQATPPVIRAILTARAMGVPTYYEIDDLLFDPAAYPPPLSTYGGAIGEEEHTGLRFSVPLFRLALSLCDRAISSTPALLEAMVPLTREGKGVLVRNGLDSRNRGLLALGARKREGDGRIRIFYGSGTLAHAEDFTSIAVPALARILNDFENVDLVLVGHVPASEAIDQFEKRVLRFPLIPSVDQYWSVLAACDLAIAVLAPGAASDAKSEIKWLEAAAAGIPTVMSSTATYCEIIKPGKNGLLAADSDEWYEAIASLCRDQGARLRMGRSAHDQILRDYSLDALAEVWREEFSAVQSPATGQQKPRILIVNVFFSPQSIGGATRVVEDNVRHLAERGEFDLAVFCTDEGYPAADGLRTTDFGGVPVFRTALRPCEDSHYDDVAALPAFRQAIDLFRPDLVHFHCVQRITAAPLRECLDRRLPYVVTLHDAWWLSPYQFLIDEQGMLRLPESDLLAGYNLTPRSTDTALRRRQFLAPLLLGARRLLAVSDEFKEIYRDAGFPATEAIPNGIPELPAPFIPSETVRGPLRMAHIGGRSSHKGSDLVEAALRRGDYPNLSLLMIDGRLPSGQVIQTQWGSSHVTLSAPWSQDAVSDLYEQIDVLLAPSRWPESFGLVTREAEHFGCWVVASRHGAIGKDVVPGRTGFLVDTENCDDLHALFSRFNASPGDWRRGSIKPSPGHRRRAIDQAEELLRVYREVLSSSSNAVSLTPAHES